MSARQQGGGTMTSRRAVWLAVLAVLQCIVWLLQIWWQLTASAPNYGVVLLACLGGVVALMQLAIAIWRLRR